MVKGTCSLWAYSEAAFFWGCLSLCVREALERDSDLFSFFSEGEGEDGLFAEDWEWRFL